jgi:hypothetical protein
MAGTLVLLCLPSFCYRWLPILCVQAPGTRIIVSKATQTCLPRELEVGLDKELLLSQLPPSKTLMPASLDLTIISLEMQGKTRTAGPLRQLTELLRGVGPAGLHTCQSGQVLSGLCQPGRRLALGLPEEHVTQSSGALLSHVDLACHMSHSECHMRDSSKMLRGCSIASTSISLGLSCSPQCRTSADVPLAVPLTCVLPACCDLPLPRWTAHTAGAP